MTDPYLFGTYYSLNINYETSFTANRPLAKWRSQFRVIATAQPVAALNEFYLLNNTVKIVAISDLDYQLKKTDPVDDKYWIKRVQGGYRVDWGFYVGSRAVNTFAHEPLVFTPVATQGNPDPFTLPNPTPKPLVNLSYLSFAEERLELGFDYGVTGGMSFATEILEVADGREQRNATRNIPLGRWQLGDRTVAQSQRDLLTEVAYLKKFHTDRKGAYQGFRFKDWSDFKALNQNIATGNGIQTQFQLKKAYKVGDAITYRPIQKPVSGTVGVFVNGVNVALTPNHGWIVNHQTGVLSNPVPLASGSILSAEFEFDIPVWFESDEISFKLEAYEPQSQDVIYSLGNVFVVEGRIPLAIPWQIQQSSEITQELDLGIIYDTTEEYEFSTQKQELKSGYTIRQSKRQDSKLSVNLGGKIYDQQEVEQILAYFWNAKGHLKEFPFKNLEKNYQARFDQDEIRFKFEAANNSDKLFNLSGLKLSVKLKEKIQYKVPPYSILAVSKLEVSPSDQNDPLVRSSNPNTTPNNGASTVGRINIATYKGSVGFNSLPIGSTVNDQWQPVFIFWAAGTVWLIANSTYYYYFSGSNWFKRCVLYKLNALGQFEYIDSNLKNYLASYGAVSDPVVTNVLKTPTGVSVFFKADNANPFGVSGNAANLGFLRFEIRNDGTFFSDFIADSAINSPFNKVSTTDLRFLAIYGNRMFISVGSTSKNVSLGVINGLEYILGNLSTSIATGFPVSFFSTGFLTPTATPNNIYETVSTNQKVKTLNYESTQLETYNTNTTVHLDLRNFRQNQEGAIFGKVQINEQYLLSNSGSTATKVAVYFAESPANIPTRLEHLTPAPNNLDANYQFVTFPNAQSSQLNHDSFGNALSAHSGNIYYYQAGSANWINIKSQVPYGVKCMQANTPYGFCLFSSNNYLFATSAFAALVFIQPQKL